MNTPRGVWLDDLTRQEAASRFAGDAVAVIPVVSVGLPAAHLPLKTAALIARALGQNLLERLAVVVAPIIDASTFRHGATLEQVLDDRLDAVKALGARRIAVLEIATAPPGTRQAPGEGLVLRVGDRLADEEFLTSCVLALDPRSVRLSLLPAGSRAQAFAGERGMSAEVDAIAGALAAKWPDLA